MDSNKIICYNESVCNNSSLFSSTLNKTHISIAYHFLRLHVEAGVIKVVWIDTNAKISNAMKKRLTSDKRGTLFGHWT